MLNIYKISALLFIGRADIFLIPCPFKYLFKIDCPGCGFQRSVLALIKGDFPASFELYPPTVPFLLSVLLGVGTWVLKLDTNAKWLKAMYFFTGFVMLGNYLYKIVFHQLH
ncbi:DUF2752 domain-containing protein [Nubsella zeaxanthinifaciens]|uniref:DUF2752 domain-containing protein n=1 Tax=Nubsella zeaxanthinifaciens TaxID=392412 RepID=UPI0018E5767F|nr:DUF2752 domain-containing protein [Nubsella zeaxanthinifaciens]